MPLDIDAWFFYDPAQPSGQNAPVLDAREVQAAFSAESVRHLGRGAFGETWRLSGGAFATDGPVAAKIIHQEGYPAARLERETDGLRRTSSPNVVRLLGRHTITLSVGPRPALLCEFIEGGDVSSAVSAGRWPSHTEAQDFAAGVLAGLAALHATDTVHRDIKPENIALRDGRWDQPVILDLGLTKQLDIDSFTRYPNLLGTLAFMAPEQIRGEEARKAADLWALGVVLRILLTWAHPFFGGWEARMDINDALRRVERGAPDLPLDVPEPLRSVAARLLMPIEHERGSARRALKELERTT